METAQLHLKTYVLNEVWVPMSKYLNLQLIQRHILCIQYMWISYVCVYQMYFVYYKVDLFQLFVNPFSRHNITRSLHSWHFDMSRQEPFVLAAFS